MSEHKDTIEIAATIENVFNYKTIPAYWPDYHPFSVKVSPEIKESALLGSKFYEIVNVLNIKQKFNWEVVKYTYPTLFEISGSVVGYFGGNATITYTLGNRDDKTLFTRRFSIKRHSALMKFFDWLLIDRVADYDGKNALKNFKRIIEK